MFCYREQFWLCTELTSLKSLYQSGRYFSHSHNTGSRVILILGGQGLLAKGCPLFCLIHQSIGKRMHPSSGREGGRKGRKEEGGRPFSAASERGWWLGCSNKQNAQSAEWLHFNSSWAKGPRALSDSPSFAWAERSLTRFLKTHSLLALWLIPTVLEK